MSRPKSDIVNVGGPSAMTGYVDEEPVHHGRGGLRMIANLQGHYASTANSAKSRA